MNRDKIITILMVVYLVLEIASGRLNFLTDPSGREGLKIFSNITFMGLIVATIVRLISWRKN